MAVAGAVEVFTLTQDELLQLVRRSIRQLPEWLRVMQVLAEGLKPLEVKAIKLDNLNYSKSAPLQFATSVRDIIRQQELPVNCILKRKASAKLHNGVELKGNVLLLVGDERKGKERLDRAKAKQSKQRKRKPGAGRPRANLQELAGLTPSS